VADDLVTVDRFNREIDRLDENVRDLDKKIAAIDQGGTRGLGVLAVQIQEQTKDITRVEATVNSIAEEQKRLRGAGWKNIIAFAIAMLPVYLFLAEQFFRGKP
jgi:hypothetical protein